MWLTVLVALVATAWSGSAIPTSELQALHAIFNATRGERWEWVAVPWNFSQLAPDPCHDKWQGVSCGSICDATVHSCVKHVLALSLESLGMDGTIPAELGGLAMLRNLTISANLALGGPIPYTIGGLSYLESLDLSRNMLNGTIPWSLTNLTSLKVLKLAVNSLQGNIPVELCRLQNLTRVDLSWNQLTGTLPREIGQLRLLAHLRIVGNLLNGSVPEEIGNLSELIELGLSNNAFVGALPASLGRLISLKLFDGSLNGFSSSIPKDIGGMISLVNLDLSYNNLTGALPANFSSLPALQRLALHYNYLRGPVPEAVGMLTKLRELLLDHNLLSGSISVFLANTSSLEGLYLNNNHFAGSVPSGLLSRMPELTDLDLSSNFLTGDIPHDLLLLPMLQTFFVHSNQMIGTLDIAWNRLTRLLAMELHSNLFRGPVPRALAQTISLAQFDAGHNLLTGCVPTGLASLSALKQLSLESNMLTGPVGFLPVSVRFANISTNFFSGQLAALNMFETLIALDVSSNALTGSLPALGANSNSTKVLFLQNNYFGGAIASYFATVSAANLINFDVSANRLTGSLPQGIVDLSSLRSFTAMENCLEGTLPISLCEMSNVEILGLDGLSTARHCRKPIMPGVLSSYYLGDHVVQGTIPACLFAMENLKTLHLSGNALSGSLPALARAELWSLRDLSLSYNQLTGSIPAVLQGGNWWNNLDLGFNKFSGHLTASLPPFSPFATVKMDQNRLSGKIPAVLYEVHDVDILRGNMFRCDRRGIWSDVPEGDPYRRKYSCGSDTLETAFLVWVILAAALVAVIGVSLHMPSLQQWWRRRWRRGYWRVDAGKEMDGVDGAFLSPSLATDACEGVETMSFIQRVVRWLGAYGDIATFVGSVTHGDPCGMPTPGLRFIFAAGVYLRCLRLLSGAVAVVLVAVASPVYIGLSLSFGTYQDQFAWTDSAAYLTGTVSAVTLAVLFISMALLLLLVRLLPKTFLEGVDASDGDDPEYRLRDESDSIIPQSNIKLGGVQNINPAHSRQPDGLLSRRGLGISPGATEPAALDQFATQQTCGFPMTHRRTALLVVVNLAVVLSANAAFVVNYSSLDPAEAVAVAVALSLFKIAWGVVLRQGVVRYLQPPGTVRALRLENVRFLSALMLFNTIVAPCLATLLVNSSCFYYLFQEPPPISSDYSFLTCGEFSGGCKEVTQLRREVEFQPPFIYRYQCSSALLVDYAYVFVYKYALLGLAYPALVVLVAWRLQGRDVEQLGWSDQVMMLALPPLWKADLLQSMHRRELDSAICGVRADERPTSQDMRHKAPRRSSPKMSWLLAVEYDALQMPAFSSCDYAVRMATMFGSLLTFGAVLPTLGVLIVLALWSTTAVTQAGLARLAERSTCQAEAEPGSATSLIEAVGRHCAQLNAAVRLAVRPLAGLVLIFYSAFVFDTQGDASGKVLGGLVALLVVVVPVVASWALHWWLRVPQVR